MNYIILTLFTLKNGGSIEVILSNILHRMNITAILKKVLYDSREENVPERA